MLMPPYFVVNVGQTTTFRGKMFIEKSKPADPYSNTQLALEWFYIHSKSKKMKHFGNVEVLILSNHSSRDRQELVKWLGTTLQLVIKKQIDRVNEELIRILADAPAFYLS
jgi:hypothetical protein